MHSYKTSSNYQKTYLVFVFILFQLFIAAQNQDSIKPELRHFSGIISATNNGISLLPNLTLGKPAVLCDLSFGKGKLTFDPMIRFAMNGRPWGFILWWRYKLVQSKKFNMAVGAHPAFIFRTKEFEDNGVKNNYTVVQRNFASEMTPTYTLSKNFSVGLHYLFAKNLDKVGFQYTNFVAFRTIINQDLSQKIHLNFVPQLYFLSLDKLSGYYVNSTISLKHKNFPIGLSSIMSQRIKSTVPGNPFVFNISLYYNFNNDYVPQVSHI